MKKKKAKYEHHRIISISELMNSIEVLKKSFSGISDSVERQKNEIIESYIKTEQYKDDFLEGVRADIQKGLSFVHDYKQINSQIAQNINVIIETQFSGNTLDEKLDAAPDPIKAIYYSSKLLEN